VAEDQKTPPPAPAATPADVVKVERISADEYKSTGKTTVRARKGYVINPTDKSLPIITDSAEVNMSKEQADALMDEAGQYLVRTEPKE
jgi:hypothetical protein